MRGDLADQHDAAHARALSVTCGIGAPAVSQLGVRTIALLCVLVACDAGENKSNAPVPIPVMPKAPPVLDGPDLTYIPANADLVFRIDVARLRTSKLWPLYSNVLERSLIPGKLCEHALDGVTTVMIGMDVTAEKNVLVFHGIDQQTLQTCLHQPGAATFDGAFATVHNTNTYDVLTFVARSTMVVERARQATRPVLDTNVQHDGALVAALAKLPTKAGMVMASRPSSKDLAAKWATLGTHLEAVTGTLTTDDDMKLEVAMVLQTHDEAEKLASMVQGQLKATTTMVDRADATAQDRTVTITVALGEPKLKTLMDSVGGLLAQ